MSDDFVEKEHLLLEFAVSSQELFIKVMNVLEPEYFEKPLDGAVRFIKEYFGEYHAVPPQSVIHAETGVKLEPQEVHRHEFNYVTDEVEDFARKSAMRLAIMDSADELGDDDGDPDYGKIEQRVRNAISISIDKDLGLNQFEDPETRLLRMIEDIDDRSIGWPQMDKLLNNVRRGESILFGANSGGGKSVVLSNVANNMAKQGLHVLYVSLELSQDLVAKRMDSIITQIDIDDILENITDVANSLNAIKDNYGSIWTKRFPAGITTNDIRAYLLEYHLQNGHYPDVIAVDYLDLLKPTVSIIGTNRFDIDKQISEDVRNLYQEYNTYGFTASQLNRDSINVASKDQSHIAGGLSKINTSDATITITRNEEHIDNGEVEFQPIKLRNATMTKKPITLHWNDKTLLIADPQATPKIKNNTGATSSKSASQDDSEPDFKDKDAKQRLKDIMSRTK